MAAEPSRERGTIPQSEDHRDAKGEREDPKLDRGVALPDGRVHSAKLAEKSRLSR